MAKGTKKRRYLRSPHRDKRRPAQPTDEGLLTRDSRAARRRAIEAAAVVLAAIAAFANTINADFTLDDVPII